jgi:hypothetical protein
VGGAGGIEGGGSYRGRALVHVAGSFHGLEPSGQSGGTGTHVIGHRLRGYFAPSRTSSGFMQRLYEA